MDKRRPCTLSEAKEEFRGNIKKLWGSLANYFFILDIKGAASRKTTLQLVLFIVWAVLSLFLLYGSGFAGLLGKSFQYLLTSPPPTENPLVKLFSLLMIEIGPMTVYFLIIVLVPFLLAYQAAAKYLADIYELEDQKIAEKFIWQAAFANQYDSISIVDGEIAEKDENSPIVQIGGPGIINVDLCSAALFERANGRPHVIGPVYKPPQKKLKPTEKLISDIKKKIPKSKKPPDNKNIIGGFERFRYAKNLHDEALAPIEVNSRTRDGIPVIAKDVRLFYSIWRGNPSAEELKAIYPYRKEAIPSFFYAASCTVSSIQKGGCTISPVDPMPGSVSGALSSFISQRSLSEFLTSVGEPEKEALRNRAQEYQNEKDKLDRTQPKTLDFSDEKFKAPDFSPRKQSNPLFAEFAEEFSINNRKKGVVLYWLGTGTWVVPANAVNEKNKDAQKLAKENAKNGSQKSLNNIESSAKREEFLRLVRLMPLQATKIIFAPNSLRESVVTEMLQSYMELIKSAHQIVDAYEEDYQDMDEMIRTDASKKIYNTIYAHWIGSPTQKPKPPAVG